MRYSQILVATLILLSCCQYTCIADEHAAPESSPDSDATADAAPPGPRVRPHPAKICVVIRTYWGHGLHSKQGLRQLLQSLSNQQHTNWEAVIIVMDTTPFDDLYTIVHEFGDNVWVYAELIGGEYNSRLHDGAWSDSYHGSLYNLTDQAIRVCSADTEWLIVTNGDNEYASTLYAELEATPDDVDLLAFDYYSRYQRSTGPPCYRFSPGTMAPKCKRNLLKWCHTDLGANVFSYPRFMREDRRFGQFKNENHTADHFDGLMLESLVDGGWKYRHLEGHCLYDHSPSPQRCARLGGVWDDSVASEMSGAGGKCLTKEGAHKKVQAFPDAYDVVVLPLSSDGNLSAWTPDHPSDILCIRYRDHHQHQLSFMYFYGPGCIDDADAQAFNWTMWDAYQDEMKRQEELAIEHFKQQVEAAKRGELVPAPQPVSVINWQSIPRPPSKQNPNKRKPKYRQKWKGSSSTRAAASQTTPQHDNTEL